MHKQKNSYEFHTELGKTKNLILFILIYFSLHLELIRPGASLADEGYCCIAAR